VRRHRASLPLYWRRFVWALLGFAVAGAVLLLLAPDFSGLYLFALYSMPANSFLPVPHEPGLLYLARYYDPWMLALAGCVGTAAAACIDYPVVKAAFRHPRIRRARSTRLYHAAVRSLMRYPFLTIVVFAATPLPVYVVRVLAPASGYPLWRYTAATMVGRFPRYFAVAWIGSQIHIPTWALLALFVILIGALVLGSRTADEAGIDGLEVISASDDQERAMTDDEAALLLRGSECDQPTGSG
jgi:membrane protein YqaA with SNARE-associated domain